MVGEFALARRVCFEKVEWHSAVEHPHDPLGQMRELPLQFGTVMNDYTETSIKIDRIDFSRIVTHRCNFPTADACHHEDPLSTPPTGFASSDFPVAPAS